MNRYQTNDIITLSNGTPIYATALPTEIVTDINDITIITGETDRLDSLAYKFYGNAQLWWAIAKANNIIDGSLFIEPGTQLVIPNKSKVV